MNIYKNVYSVRKLVVYIRLCENSCQSQTVVKAQTTYLLRKKKNRSTLQDFKLQQLALHSVGI